MDIPSSVKSIADGAFNYCRGVASVTIPPSVTQIEGAAFFQCSGLTSVTIPSSVTYIGKSAFRECSSLTSATILSPDVEIAERMFEDCTNLTSVTMVEGVNHIGKKAFFGCKKLLSVTIPSSVEEIGEDAFSGLNEIRTIYTGVGATYRLKRMLANSGMYVDGIEFIEKDLSAVPTEDEPVVDPTKPTEGPDTPVVGPANPTEEPDTPAVDPTKPTEEPDTPVVEPEPMRVGETTGGIAEKDAAPYAAAAAVYDGYVYVGKQMKGSVQLKIAKGKVDKKTGKFAAKVTATVQLADGTKKLSFKNGVADETGAITAMSANGWTLAPAVGVDGLGGTLVNGSKKYELDGVRNIFTAKDAASKAAAGKALGAYQGVYCLAWDAGCLTVTVAAKGKAKVAGTVNGVKVTATSQLLVGAGCACVPVVEFKKAYFAFNLWLEGGKVEVGDVEGAEQVAPFGAVAGKAGTQLGAAITIGELPAGYSRFEDAKSEAMKLKLNAKTGAISGSFKVFTLVNGKQKKASVAVTGVQIGSVGYCTGTIKKVGSVPITVR